MAGRRRKEPEERFWPKVDKRGPDECWPWTASRNVTGYGKFSVGGKGGWINASRAAWGFANGAPAPEGMLVCHRCDNPPCCNPAHLFLGTPKDNMRDMIAKGRQDWSNAPRGDRHPARRPGARQGIRNGRRRLSIESLNEARRDVHERGMSVAEAARRMGMSPSAMHSAVFGVTWSHVPFSDAARAAIAKARGES